MTEIIFFPRSVLHGSSSKFFTLQQTVILIGLMKILRNHIFAMMCITALGLEEMVASTERIKVIQYIQQLN